MSQPECAEGFAGYLHKPDQRAGTQGAAALAWGYCSPGSGVREQEADQFQYGQGAFAGAGRAGVIEIGRASCRERV